MRLNISQMEVNKSEVRYGTQARTSRPGLFVNNCQCGFTLVELIMTMVIIGVLGVVVAPRFFDNNVFQSRGFADQVQASLRFAQKTAIAKRRFVCVAIPTANSMMFTQGSDSTCGNNLASPTGETSYTIQNDNVAITAPTPGNFISFDCLGRPRAVGNPAAVCTPGNVVGVLAINPVVQVDGAPPIIIEAETGYVHSL